MTRPNIPASLLETLRAVDTPTVCNAIEVVEGKRGFDRFTRGTMLCSDPEGGAIVGYAATANRRCCPFPAGHRLPGYGVLEDVKTQCELYLAKNRRGLWGY